MSSRPYVPPALRPLRALGSIAAIPIRANAQLGHQAVLLVQAIAAIPMALRHYRREVLRLIADIGWGNGSIIVGGGTIGVIIALCGFAGITIGMESYQALNLLTMAPLTGAISSFASTRELAPLVAALAFVIQSGCRFTAQLGSMRIAEEIDALESVAIRPLPYLISTRIIAAVVTIIPLYSIGLVVAYLTTEGTVLVLGGTTTGTYEHYYYQFLNGDDIYYSFLKVLIFTVLAAFIQCYYGFVAVGGPEGVGVAAGKAIRMVIIVMVIVNLILTLSIWGITPPIRISG